MTDNGSKSGSGDNQDDSAVNSGDNVVPLKPVEHRGGDTTGGKLTAKQHKFVQGILKGMTQSDAYRAAGYKVDGCTDKSVWELASHLFANVKVSSSIKAGQTRQEDVAVHSGASLRLFLEKELYGMATSADSDANKLRALQLLGQGEKCGYFLERSTSLTPDDLSPDQVLEELEARLAKAFEPKAS